LTGLEPPGPEGHNRSDPRAPRANRNASRGPRRHPWCTGGSVVSYAAAMGHDSVWERSEWARPGGPTRR
jgi:hypothetical protein